MSCEEPVTIIEILRLTEAGHSQRQIAASVRCSKTTVGEIQKSCREIGLSYDQASLVTGDDFNRDKGTGSLSQINKAISTGIYKSIIEWDLASVWDKEPVPLSDLEERTPVQRKK